MVNFRTNKNKKTYPISKRRVSVGSYQQETVHLRVPKTLSESYRMKKLDKIHFGTHDKEARKVYDNINHKIDVQREIDQIDARLDDNLEANKRLDNVREKASLTQRTHDQFMLRQKTINNEYDFLMKKRAELYDQGGVIGNIHTYPNGFQVKKLGYVE